MGLWTNWSQHFSIYRLNSWDIASMVPNKDRYCKGATSHHEKWLNWTSQIYCWEIMGLYAGDWPTCFKLSYKRILLLGIYKINICFVLEKLYWKTNANLFFKVVKSILHQSDGPWRTQQSSKNTLLQISPKQLWTFQVSIIVCISHSKYRHWQISRKSLGVFKQRPI